MMITMTMMMVMYGLMTLTLYLWQFYSEALECEYDMSLTIYKLQSKLRTDVDSTGSLPPNVTFGILQVC